MARALGTNVRISHAKGDNICMARSVKTKIKTQDEMERHDKELMRIIGMRKRLRIHPEEDGK